MHGTGDENRGPRGSLSQQNAWFDADESHSDPVDAVDITLNGHQPPGAGETEAAGSRSGLEFAEVPCAGNDIDGEFSSDPILGIGPGLIVHSDESQ